VCLSVDDMSLEADSSSNPTWIVLSVVGVLIAGVAGFIYYADQQRRALKGDQQDPSKKRVSKKKQAKEARSNRAQFSMG